MNETIYNFQLAVFDKLTEAFKKYNITSIDVEDVIVHCDVKGKCAGKAGYKTIRGQREYFLKFNEQAIHEYYQEQVESTLPHEVAHLICYLRPELGKNHDAGWRSVAKALGDVSLGARTHNMNLRAGKAKTEYEYNVNGNIVMLGPKRHKKTQTGMTVYTHRQFGKIQRDMFVKKVTTRPDNQQIITTPNAKPAPSKTVRKPSSTSLTKAEQALALYNAMSFRGESRAAVVSAFMEQLDMTKAGASTYYYNAKKKADV